MLWERAQAYPDTEAGRLSLTEIRHAHTDFTQDTESEDSVLRADRFLRWTEAYWRKRRHQPDDAITCAFYA